MSEDAGLALVDAHQHVQDIESHYWAPNVVVKLSGFGLGHPRWTVADMGPLLERTLAIFGPDRVMVGTNLLVDRLFAAGQTILGARSRRRNGGPC